MAKRNSGIRSYEVLDEDNRVMRRNRRHLRKTEEYASSDDNSICVENEASHAGNDEAELETVKDQLTLRQSARNIMPPAYLKDYVCRK